MDESHHGSGEDGNPETNGCEVISGDHGIGGALSSSGDSSMCDDQSDHNLSNWGKADTDGLEEMTIHITIAEQPSGHWHASERAGKTTKPTLFGRGSTPAEAVSNYAQLMQDIQKEDED